MIPISMTCNDPRAYVLSRTIYHLQRTFSDDQRAFREQASLAILRTFLEWRDDGLRDPRTIDAIEIATRDLLEGE